MSGHLPKPYRSRREDRLQSIRAEFLDRAGRDLRRTEVCLGNGLQGHLEELLSIYHGLKGTAGTCGFDRFGHHCAEFERALRQGSPEEFLREALGVLVGEHISQEREFEGVPRPRPERGASAPKEVLPQVLCIEDDPDIATLLRFALRPSEFEVEVIEDGLGGWRRLQSGPVPSALLLDLMLPGLTGFEVLERVRGDARLADLPVIVLSARLLENESNRAMQLGATAFLPKPFEIPELHRLVKELAA